MFVQADDDDHRHETELKTGADHGFGPQDHDDQCANRQQTQADRLTPDRQPGHDQQGRHAGADRRHLRTGQQRITHTGSRTGSGRQQHQRPAQRDPRREREQAIDDKDDDADQSRDMQPADRQQMGKPALTHGVLIGRRDAAAVSGGHRDRERSRRAIDLLGDMIRQPAADFEAAILLSTEHDYRRHDPPGCADAVKISAPCIIIAARERGRRGWHQPHPNPHDIPMGKGLACGFCVVLQVETDARRQVGPSLRRGDEPGHAACRQRLHPLDPRVHGDKGGAREDGRAKQGRLRPGQKAPASSEQQEEAGRTGKTATAPSDQKQSHRAGERQADEGHPVGPGRQYEPSYDPHRQRHRAPKRQLSPLRLQPMLDAARSRRQSPARHVQRRGLSGSKSRARGVRVHRGNPFHSED